MSDDQVRAPEDAPSLGRDERGQFVKGNTVGVVHGLSARYERLDLAVLKQIRDAVMADHGGEACSEILKAQIAAYARASLLEETAFNYIVAGGPLTQTGRPRALCYLFLKASGRAERLATQIGLARAKQASITDIRATPDLTKLSSSELAELLAGLAEDARKLAETDPRVVEE
jgi:hypothetical protein